MIHFCRKGIQRDFDNFEISHPDLPMRLCLHVRVWVCVCVLVCVSYCVCALVYVFSFAIMSLFRLAYE